MALTIDIDTGGTFTDGFFADDEEFRLIKVETTPHDLTVCFWNCIEEGAKALGFDSPRAMLEKAGAVKFSTTVATNTMIQKSGPKLGLIVTRGHEQDLYSDDGVGPLPLKNLVPANMIVGIKGGADNGEVEQPELEEVRATVRYLLTAGARAIVVCLKGSFKEPSPETRIKEMILGDYPKHYLGAVPVFLASELCTRWGDYERLNSTAVNSYLHRELARYLYKAEEDLRQSCYRKPLLIIHSTGGAARVAKTTALHTYNSGPVAGFLGSLAVARQYRIENVASVDMGGTSTDIGIIARDRFDYQFRPEVGGIPLNVPMIHINAIGGGGGSLARVDSSEDGIRVGPESAGALPGPACYGLGGTEPTVTDADLVLGFINPERFLGGRRLLDVEKAAKAIEEKVSAPLGIEVHQAAALIKERVDSMIAAAIEEDIAGRGFSPDDFTLFIYGGAGSCHCCGFGQRFERLYTFPYSAVFSAFGASTLDVMHVYERVVEIELADDSGSLPMEVGLFNGPVEEMKKAALRDLRGEGFGEETAVLGLEFQLAYADRPLRPLMVKSPHLVLEDEGGIADILEALAADFELLTGEEPPAGSPVALKALRLTAYSPVEHATFPTHQPAGEDSSHALTGKRRVYWSGSPVETGVYDRELLRCGNVVVGPAIIEQDDTTYVIPGGRKLSVDRYLSGVIERA